MTDIQTPTSNPPAPTTPPTVHPIPANPYRFGTLAAAVIVLGAAAGLVWTMWADRPNPQLSFAALAVAVVLLTAQATRFNRFAARHDPFHQG